MSGEAEVLGARGCLGQKETTEGQKPDPARTMEVVWKIVVSPETCGNPVSVLKPLEDRNGGGQYTHICGLER